MTTLDDGQGLNPEESIAASLVGTAVDYLSRFMDGTAVEEAFEISLLGARAMRMEAKAFGPVTADGFTMEGAYTATITTGDGDFLTKDTLWDFKVTTGKPNKDHTLQLLIYYLMGRRSIHPEFQTIEKLGIFNPRQNTIYQLPIFEISDQVIKEVETNVIGY